MKKDHETRKGPKEGGAPAQPEASIAERRRKKEKLAAEIVKDMIHTSGLGMYIKFLQSASMMANREGKKVTWDHFVIANDIIAKLSRTSKEE